MQFSDDAEDTFAKALSYLQVTLADQNTSISFFGFLSWQNLLDLLLKYLETTEFHSSSCWSGHLAWSYSGL